MSFVEFCDVCWVVMKLLYVRFGFGVFRYMEVINFGFVYLWFIEFRGNVFCEDVVDNGFVVRDV